MTWLLWARLVVLLSLAGTVALLVWAAARDRT
jgi:hypothetical protein